jgi:hypothetical protein
VWAVSHFLPVLNYLCSQAVAQQTKDQKETAFKHYVLANFSAGVAETRAKEACPWPGDIDDDIPPLPCSEVNPGPEPESFDHDDPRRDDFSGDVQDPHLCCGLQAAQYHKLATPPIPPAQVQDGALPSTLGMDRASADHIEWILDFTSASARQV